MRISSLNRLFLSLCMIILFGGLSFSQSYVININTSDTVKYKSFVFSNPVVLQIETNSITGTQDGKLYIYTKTSYSNNYNQLQNDSIPLTIKGNMNRVLLIEHPYGKDWKILYDKNGSTAGGISISIEQLLGGVSNK
jgi:hypothetical protein